MPAKRGGRSTSGEYRRRLWATAAKAEQARRAQEALEAKRTGGYEDSIVLWKAQKAMSTATLITWKVSEQLKLFKALRKEIWEWIDSYETNEKSPGEGFALFKSQWKVLRLGIGLQVRLLVEQVLYDRGSPWSRLCTGFNAIGD